MQIILERHRYATELNTAYLGPTRTKMRVPGCTTISEVRKKHFAPLKYTGRYVVLSSKYPAPFEWLNERRSGFCNDLRSLAGALTVFRKKLDSRQNPKMAIKSKLIG